MWLPDVNEVVAWVAMTIGATPVFNRLRRLARWRWRYKAAEHSLKQKSRAEALLSKIV